MGIETTLPKAEKDDVQGALQVALVGLKEMFLNGQLLPGEQIRQQQIADQLGISRVPLREALNILAKHGPLIHKPNQGYFVAKRLPIEHAQTRRMLELLENELMASVAWPDKATWVKLCNLQEAMRPYADAADWTPMLSLNRQFHFEIFGLSPYKLILEQVDRLWTLGDPYMASKLSSSEARAQTLREHDQLLAAIKAKDRTLTMQILDIHRAGGVEGTSHELPSPPTH